MEHPHDLPENSMVFALIIKTPWTPTCTVSHMNLNKSNSSFKVFDRTYLSNNEMILA